MYNSTYKSENTKFVRVFHESRRNKPCGKCWLKRHKIQATPNISFSSGILGSVCLLESSFFFKVNYFLMFSNVMKNKLENTFQCLVMLRKMSSKITY